MTDIEIKQVQTMINTLGYYQCFEAVKEWFGWDSDTTSKNIKEAFNKGKNE